MHDENLSSNSFYRNVSELVYPSRNIDFAIFVILLISFFRTRHIVFVFIHYITTKTISNGTKTEKYPAARFPSSYSRSAFENTDCFFNTFHSSTSRITLSCKNTVFVVFFSAL